MKKGYIFLLTVLLACSFSLVQAQCSICSKTSAQQGEKAGRGMNGGIVYLMFIPFGIMGYIGYRWWKQEKEELV
jgi:hypothetical protein